MQIKCHRRLFSFTIVQNILTSEYVSFSNAHNTQTFILIYENRETTVGVPYITVQYKGGLTT